MKDYRVLDAAIGHARAFLDTLAERPVGRPIEPHVLREALGGPMPEHGEDAAQIIDALVRDADAGLVATAGPRYYGFVIGGSLPVTVAADWLTSVWDQNAGLYVSSPGAAIVEEVAGAWMLQLLGLPASASVGFVTGTTMANFTGLAAARHDVLRRAGWDVEADGLNGAPKVTVVAGEEAHATIFLALRLLGLGARRTVLVPADDQGRIRADALAEALHGRRGPLIVCAQAGNVHTGACDPFPEIVELARTHGAWLHVDGAFGLWAAVSPELHYLTRGLEAADSWTVDGHKWLNVPYDCGVAITAHPDAHRAAMSLSAAYFVAGAARDPMDWTPESSRRARGFTVYAALRALGRSGVQALIEQSCRQARQMAAVLRTEPGVEILNDVVLNQVLVRFRLRGGGDPDELTQRVIARVQRDGTCWLAGTVWHGRAAMRISVSGWATNDDDIGRSAQAILRAYNAEAAA